LRIAGAAAAFRDALGAPLAPGEHASLDRALTAARQGFGSVVADDASRDGRRLRVDDIIVPAADVLEYLHSAAPVKAATEPGPVAPVVAVATTVIRFRRRRSQ
jgi:hypothetical protein